MRKHRVRKASAIAAPAVKWGWWEWMMVAAYAAGGAWVAWEKVAAYAFAAAWLVTWG